VAPQLTLVGVMVLYAKEPRAGQLGITLLTTWSLAVSPQEEFPSLKSRWGYSVLTGKDQTASLLTLAERQLGKSLCWDVTVTCPLGKSYIDRAALEAGAAAELAATRKEERNTSTSVLVTSLSQLR